MKKTNMEILQQIIEEALKGVNKDFELKQGKCACLNCTLRRKGEAMLESCKTTLQQIEDNELDCSAVAFAKEVVQSIAEYRTDMFIRASTAAATHNFPALAKAYNILAEARRQLGEIHEELFAERDTKQAAMDAKSEPLQETPEEEPLPSR